MAKAARRELEYPPLRTVTVERTVTERMVVGIVAASDSEARDKVMALDKVRWDAGWTRVGHGETTVTSIVDGGLLSPLTGRRKK